MKSPFELVAIGCSTGGLAALEKILPQLPADFPAALVVVMHSVAGSRNLLVELLARQCRLPVREAAEKTAITPGTIFVAPPGYHLLIEDDRTFSLSTDPKVSYVRPSVDVLFETAANAFGKKLIGIVLTGANSDGSAGLGAIAENGGLCLVQDPSGAEARIMPETAIRSCKTARIVPLERMAETLTEVMK